MSTTPTQRALQAAVEARVIDRWQRPLFNWYLVTDLAGRTHSLTLTQIGGFLAPLVRGWAPVAHEHPEAWERLLDAMEDLAATMTWWEVTP